MVVAALLGCPPPAPPDVILVTLDTTRADRLGAYGYADGHTDAIDAIAAAGRRYERAYAPVPLTIPSHAAIMTGRYPADLGVRGNGDAPLSDDALTLAEILGARGYATGASVAAFVTTRKWGFSQGFDAYFDEIPKEQDNLWHAERPGEAVVNDAIAWWVAQPSTTPRFLWVHLYDAHFPYVAPPSYLAAADKRPYDAELAYVDDQVARLVSATAGREVVWVLVGDHGEGLGDHGELTHGMFVYEATQRVPFVLAGPGIAPEVVSRPVSLVDVAPAVLTALGVPLPSGMVAPSDVARPIYMDAFSLRDRFGLTPHVGVIDGADLLIDVPRPELYDVVADPAQRTDRAAHDAARVAELKALLDAFGFAAPAAGARGFADADVAAALSALGYTEGGFTGDVTGPLPDPKDHASLIKRSQRAERLDIEHDYAAAVAIYEELVREYPRVIELRNRLAIDLDRLDRRPEAIAMLEQAVSESPGDNILRSTLAAMYGREGRHRQAAEQFVICATATPYNARLRHGALMATISDERPPDAIALGLGWLATYPDDHGTAGLVGLAYARTGELDRAIPYLERGMNADPPPINNALRLAEAAARRGDATAAASFLEQEVAAHPENTDAADRLIPVLSDAARWTDLAATGAAIVAVHPEKPLYWHAWAQARFNLADYTGAREVLVEGLKRHPESSLLVLLDANLLAKEGRLEEGRARFEHANALREAGR